MKLFKKKKKSNWYKEGISSETAITTLVFMQQTSYAIIVFLHNNVSQNQHMKLMIKNFLITKHREDNWKNPSGRGILKRYFCVSSTTGTNSEAGVPGGPVCLLQNWFTKSEWTSTQSEANSCLRGNQQQRSAGWNRIFTAEQDMFRITVLLARSWCL